MITDYIGHGRANAVTREELCAITGLSDREVRRCIAEARASGVPIVSSSHSAGYYIATTYAEREIILRELASRMGKLGKVYRAIRKMGEGEDQLSIEGICEEAAVGLLLTSVDYLGRETKHEHLHETAKDESRFAEHEPQEVG